MTGTDIESLRGLEALRAAAAGAATPRDVGRWSPPYCGDIGLAIRADGVWTYQGSAITRMGLVKLFASILRKDEDGRTYLVTPVEKVDCAVADAPFLAVEMAVSGEGREQVVSVRTNVDDVVSIGPDHPLRFEVQQPGGGLKPYVRVRGRLEALLTRPLYHDLVSMLTEHEGRLGIWSGGHFWAAPGEEGAPI